MKIKLITKVLKNVRLTVEIYKVVVLHLKVFTKERKIKAKENS